MEFPTPLAIMKYPQYIIYLNYVHIYIYTSPECEGLDIRGGCQFDVRRSGYGKEWIWFSHSSLKAPLIGTLQRWFCVFKDINFHAFVGYMLEEFPKIRIG